VPADPVRAATSLSSRDFPLPASPISNATPPGPDRHKPTKALNSLARPTKAARPGNARTSKVWPRTNSHGLARDRGAHGYRLGPACPGEIVSAQPIGAR